jgi:hypothetical protein
MAEEINIPVIEDPDDPEVTAAFALISDLLKRALKWEVGGGLSFDSGPTGQTLWGGRGGGGDGQHAVVMAGGISPAPDDDTLGQGPIMLREDDGEGNLTDGEESVCWINFTVGIPEGTRITVVPYRGDWTIPGADCPPDTEVTPT